MTLLRDVEEISKWDLIKGLSSMLPDITCRMAWLFTPGQKVGLGTIKIVITRPHEVGSTLLWPMEGACCILPTGLTGVNRLRLVHSGARGSSHT